MMQPTRTYIDLGVEYKAFNLNLLMMQPLDYSSFGCIIINLLILPPISYNCYLYK